ncbi:TonB-dependent siderophore receptor [Sphingomonas sp. SUN039]|uniref:TonB-dependent receptor plug domain-containing protein n=1 Tax=Sphingomonas sp. SUN039 TaxID=2937787 RepID=UPI0021648D72|nr:TonB-dependent receptor [Sphingomonas sp. SUN039]UVO52991.1 TonB-dependent receptor [Sphingomonas sp. SUN039]
MSRFKIAAAAIALLPAAAFAQDNTSLPARCGPGVEREVDLGDGSVFPAVSCKSTDITVTATRVAQLRNETGLSITSLNRTQIESRQTTSVADLLSTTPGITVSRNGGAGQPTAVRIRGAEGDQTLVLLDGVRVNDVSATGGGFDFGNLLAGNIERIEVLRGPNSVPWGSQAIGGVVNIVTAPPSGGFSAALNAEYGYSNAKKLVGNVRGGFGPVRASFGGGYFDDDGISAFKLGTERDGYRQYAANGRVEIDLADSVTLDLRGNYADSKVGFDGFPPPFFAFADTTGFSTTKQAFGYAGLNAALFGGALKNRLAFTISDTNRASYSSATATASRFKGRSERFEYQGDATVSGWLRAVFGVEHENSRFSDATTTYRTGVTSGYAQLIANPVAALTLTGGVRVDDHRTYGTKATFSANAAWRIGSGTVLRASYGEGFKAPTLYQLYGFYGTTTLSPETAQSYDLGVEQSLVEGTLKIGATLFHRDTTNQIDFTTTAARPNGVYVNTARTRAQGFETFVELRPSRTLVLNANYTYTDAKNRLTDTVLLRRPQHSVNANLDWTPHDWLRLGASVQTVSDSRDSDYQTFSPTSLDGYTLLSLRASVSLGERFELYGRVENLTDTRYETVSGYGVNGRNAHVGVRVKL